MKNSGKEFQIVSYLQIFHYSKFLNTLGNKDKICIEECNILLVIPIIDHLSEYKLR